MKNIALLFLSFLVFTGLQAQNNITLKPNATQGKDAMVWTAPNLFYDNLNYETDNRLLCHAWTNSGVPDKSRVLIEFDFSTLPKGAIITKATLTLFNNPTPYTNSFNGEHSEQLGTNESVLYRVIEPWLEDTVNWNNQPAYTSADQIQLARLNNNHADLIIPVTNMVYDMVNNPSTNFGFMLTLSNETRYKALVFASSDDADSTKWPQLDIEYAMVGIKTIAASNKSTFNLYPNPALSETTVYFSNDNHETWSLNVYNDLGQVITEIKNLNNTNYTIETDSFAPGTYHVLITTEQGFTTVKKMIKM